MSKIQNSNIKSAADLGGDKTLLPSSSKIYTAKSSNDLETVLRKNKDDATVAPAVSNDNTEGYEVGSRWTDVTNDKVYFALDVSTGAAIWQEVGAGGGGSLTVEDEDASPSITATKIIFPEGTLSNPSAGVAQYNGGISAAQLNISKPIRYTTNAANTVANATVTFIDYEDQVFDGDGLVLGAGSGNVTTTNTGWRWVSNRSGKVHVTANIRFDNANIDADEELQIRIYKNGTFYSAKNKVPESSNASPSVNLSITDTVSVVDGDRIEIAVNQNTGATIAINVSGLVNFVNIYFIDGENSVITPTFTDKPVRYSTNAGTAIPTGVVAYIDFEDVSWDEDGLVLGAGSSNVTVSGTGWRWVANRSGKINVNAVMRFTDADFDVDENCSIRINKNGVLQTRKNWTAYASLGAPTITADINDDVNVNANDYIEISISHSAGGDLSPTATGVENYICIKYIDRESLSVNPFETKHQQKFLSADATVASADHTDLKFSNLEIGKMYKATMHVQFNFSGSAGNAQLQMKHNGSILTEARYDSPDSTTNAIVSETHYAIFEATATTVIFESIGLNVARALAGNGAADETWTMLEELPNHKVTTQWT